MSGKDPDNLRFWPPPEGPAYLSAFLIETQAWGAVAVAVAPLQADELIATAQRRTGLTDFGGDHWREPFKILVRSAEEEADLHLFGRLWTRQELIHFLETRLKIEAEYAAPPEIEGEVINQPVFITGLPRSGTSILFELLVQDSQFMAPANWEFLLPCPLPEATSYRFAPRVPRAHDLITQASRVAPTFQFIHEIGAWIPNECGVAWRMGFRSSHFAVTFQVPTFSTWLFSADQTPMYVDYKRLLKLLQWKFPRDRWLLMSPVHQSFLPTLFKVFPDVKVVMTHRDLVRAQEVCNQSDRHHFLDTEQQAVRCQGLRTIPCSRRGGRAPRPSNRLDRKWFRARRLRHPFARCLLGRGTRSDVGNRLRQIRAFLPRRGSHGRGCISLWQTQAQVRHPSLHHRQGRPYTRPFRPLSGLFRCSERSLRWLRSYRDYAIKVNQESPYR